jgi:transposase
VRDELRGLSTIMLVRHCAGLKPATPADGASAAVFIMRLLARRIDHLAREIADLDTQMTAVLADHNPRLLDTYGAGPDTASALLIAAGDKPGRLHSEASFAALCGASPVEASSGKTERHRLNRGGDRQANCALHTIVLSRLRWDPRTRSYLDRRVAEGKTRREAVRCLKRYAAREIYGLITHPDHAVAPAAA